MADTCIWTGASGKEYEYEIFPIRANWTDKPGNYIFAASISPGKWQALYIGETISFIDELPYHDELSCIQSNGATHVHARIVQDSQARLAEEKDLLANYDTLCNR